MMTDPNYRAKMLNKIRLAVAAGIELVILQPEDLRVLDRRLSFLKSTGSLTDR